MWLQNAALRCGLCILLEWSASSGLASGSLRAPTESDMRSLLGASGFPCISGSQSIGLVNLFSSITKIRGLASHESHCSTGGLSDPMKERLAAVRTLVT
ncbi:hypothetical protein AOQ84DRAFT_97156 [Glonium stellatum]|uniref:Secreted protein n=1 Tax=Glonium stellatum TaxID=574774 RepID=A0A8E2JQ66_9PEZI|nr:hypothetical protein AOQ84DRAFT_97156 [Glonium stellatum]